MKKTFFAIVVAAAILSISSCKKDSGDDKHNNGGQSFTPAYIPPSQPGIIQVSQRLLALHVGESATITAQTFKSDGSLQSNQPNFIWNVGNGQIASVANGLVTAIGTGNTVVTVTDGSHGVEYIDIAVVESAVNISSDASSIAFIPPVLQLEKNQSLPFSYFITNLQGQSVSATPSFSATSGLSISGNSLRAPNEPGTFKVIAINGNDTLSGALQVIVFDPQISSTDTTLSVTDLIRYPLVFNKNDLTADPIRIQVTQIIQGPGATIDIQTFQTSPDEITIAHPEVVSCVNGKVTSVKAGRTEVTMKYADLILHNRVFVYFDFTGNWKGGDIELCIGYNSFIDYFKTWDVPQTTSLYFSTANGKIFINDACNPDLSKTYPVHAIPNSCLIDGPIKPDQWVCGEIIVDVPYACNSNPDISGISYGFKYIDDNNIKLNNGSKNTFARGVGNCNVPQGSFSLDGTTYSGTVFCDLDLSSGSKGFTITLNSGEALTIVNAPASGTATADSISTLNYSLGCANCPAVTLFINQTLYSARNVSLTRTGSTLTFNGTLYASFSNSNHSLSGSIECP